MICRENTFANTTLIFARIRESSTGHFCYEPRQARLGSGSSSAGFSLLRRGILRKLCVVTARGGV